MFLADIMSKEITKIDPENNRMPAKNIKDICILDFSVNKEELLIKSKAKTWYIIYRTPVSKLCMDSGSSLSLRAWAPKAPSIIVIKPNIDAMPKLFLVIDCF